jgi:predicted ATPase
MVHRQCGMYSAVEAEIAEEVALANGKGSPFWAAFGTIAQRVFIGGDRQSLRCFAKDTSGLDTMRATATAMWLPHYLSCLARTYADVGQFDDAWRCIGEAMAAIKTTNERWCEAEINRIAGEISLMSPEPDTAKAETYFARALEVARQQQAKSWELRAAMSMARLWCDQGKPQQARDLLAPVYGWFTEGFDTLDLKEAKALLDELTTKPH